MKCTKFIASNVQESGTHLAVQRDDLKLKSEIWGKKLFFQNAILCQEKLFSQLYQLVLFDWKILQSNHIA